MVFALDVEEALMSRRKEMFNKKFTHNYTF